MTATLPEGQSRQDEPAHQKCRWLVAEAAAVGLLPDIECCRRTLCTAMGCTAHHTLGIAMMMTMAALGDAQVPQGVEVTIHKLPRGMA